MQRLSLGGIFAVIVGLAASGFRALDAQSASATAVDPTLAQWGERVWNQKQCFGCHELGHPTSTGPDLIGVTDRRGTDWLRRWLANPIEMAADDSVGAALKQQYNSQMPRFTLNAHDIDGLIAFLAAQTQLRASK